MTIDPPPRCFMCGTASRDARIAGNSVSSNAACFHTKDHEWIELTGIVARSASRITPSGTGDVVYVDLPDVGDALKKVNPSARSNRSKRCLSYAPLYRAGRRSEHGAQGQTRGRELESARHVAGHPEGRQPCRNGRLARCRGAPTSSSRCASSPSASDRIPQARRDAGDCRRAVAGRTSTGVHRLSGGRVRNLRTASAARYLSGSSLCALFRMSVTSAPAPGCITPA